MRSESGRSPSEIHTSLTHSTCFLGVWPAVLPMQEVGGSTARIDGDSFGEQANEGTFIGGPRKTRKAHMAVWGEDRRIKGGGGATRPEAGVGRLRATRKDRLKLKEKLTVKLAVPSKETILVEGSWPYICKPPNWERRAGCMKKIKGLPGRDPRTSGT